VSGCHAVHAELAGDCHLGGGDPSVDRLYLRHDARPQLHVEQHHDAGAGIATAEIDRKSTRLNSSHVEISYAVFCLKKKKDEHNPPICIANLNCRYQLLLHIRTKVLSLSDTLL